MIWTYSDNTRTRRFGDFKIIQTMGGNPLKVVGLALTGTLEVNYPYEKATLIREINKAWKDLEDVHAGRDLIPLDEDGLEDRVRELEQTLREKDAWIKELEEAIEETE